MNVASRFDGLRQRVFPYRGTWHLPWVAQRYLPGTLAQLTVRKAANAATALCEMHLGRTQVRSRPFVLRIEPCNVCNLRCPRCVCGTGRDPRPKGFLSVADFRMILEQNRDHAFVLRLDGMGEPTLHPDLPEMIGVAKEFGLAVSLSTNLNARAWEDPRVWVASGLDRLVVCLDGVTPESYARYRIGGSLEAAVKNVRRLMQARTAMNRNRPLVEVQFIDFGYNHAEVPMLRALAREWGVDRVEIVAPERRMHGAKVDPRRPHRCFWLWTVLTVDWDLNYHACTNSWSLPWPRLNLRDVPSADFWNHESMREARQYSVSRGSPRIAGDPGCKCHRCVDMLSAPLIGDYWCE